jgi:hypothetical protein
LVARFWTFVSSFPRGFPEAGAVDVVIDVLVDDAPVS